ncbi:hypothetical protein U1Q18_014520 [Sarracenia purpurea var. burkii]
MNAARDTVKALSKAKEGRSPINNDELGTVIDWLAFLRGIDPVKITDWFNAPSTTKTKNETESSMNDSGAYDLDEHVCFMGYVALDLGELGMLSPIKSKDFFWVNKSKDLSKAKSSGEPGCVVDVRASVTNEAKGEGDGIHVTIKGPPRPSTNLIEVCLPKLVSTPLANASLDSICSQSSTELSKCEGVREVSKETQMLISSSVTVTQIEHETEEKGILIDKGFLPDSGGDKSVSEGEELESEEESAFEVDMENEEQGTGPNQVSCSSEVNLLCSSDVFLVPNHELASISLPFDVNDVGKLHPLRMEGERGLRVGENSKSSGSALKVLDNLSKPIPWENTQGILTSKSSIVFSDPRAASESPDSVEISDPVGADTELVTEAKVQLPPKRVAYFSSCVRRKIGFGLEEGSFGTRLRLQGS